jgi:hypothetical protein
MSSLSIGVLGGIIFGAIAVLGKLPLEFPDKRAALAAAWAVGLTFGLLLSVPETIITKA